MHFRGQNLFFKILILRKILWHISLVSILNCFHMALKVKCSWIHQSTLMRHPILIIVMRHPI